MGGSDVAVAPERPDDGSDATLAAPPVSFPAYQDHDQDRVDRLAAQYGLSYHVTYLAMAERYVGVRDRRVLEVGGSLPQKLVQDEFGAMQWVALEDLSYYAELHAKTDSLGKRVLLTDQTTPESFGDYVFLEGTIEKLPSAFEGKFDRVISFAAFEHIATLGFALEKMHMALREGGLLFALFAPIWPSAYGHHLPTVTDKSGRAYHFGNSSSPFPPWAHLMMSPAVAYQYLCGKMDSETAAQIVYYTYHSPHINRLFMEDYEAYFRASKFEVLAFEPLFNTPAPDEVKARVASRFPARHIEHEGIIVALQK